MENTTTDIWYSGDWKTVNNPTAPYNGVTISATANYTPETSPPSTMTLVSLDVVVTDYTYNPQGVSSVVTLYKPGTIYYIPIPVNDTVSPPQPNAQFTIVGIDDSSYGKLSLDSNTNGLYLNIQFSYGMEYYQREELGYIMRISPTYTDTDDVIRVEV